MRSGVILAGGKNSRMKSDKCIADFRGTPMIYYTYSALINNVDEIIISVSQNRDTSEIKEIVNDNDIIFVTDNEKFKGPVHGMLSAFKQAKGDYVAVGPCDSPFIKSEFYSMLFEFAEGYDGAVPMINNHWEPLHAVYEREKSIIAIEKILQNGFNKPIDAYPHMNIRKITEDDIKSFDFDLLSFININTKKNLASALKLKN